MQALDVHVEDEVGIHHHALLIPEHFHQLLLLGELHLIKLGNQLVVDDGLQDLEPVELGEEAGAHILLEKPGELGVGEPQPPPGRDAVGLVLELLGEDRVPVPEDVVLENLGVDLGHAVDRRGEVDGEVGHVNAVIPDQGEAGVLLPAAVVQPPEDFHDLREDLPHEVEIPRLQRLGHDGVVGVGEGLPGHGHGGIKVQSFGHQKADELGNGEGGVGVVELDGGGLVEVHQILAVSGAVDPQNVLEGRAGENILLADAQELSLAGFVVGVEDAGDVLGAVLLLERLFEIPGIEGVEVQLLLRLALPQAQCADVVGMVAENGHVVGHGDDGLVGEGDLHGMLFPAVAPGIAVAGPVVGHFLLVACLVEALLEEAEAVAEAVAREGNALGDGAVQEAGGQAPQAAVAQCGVLDVFELGKIHALFGEGAADGMENAHVEEVGVDQPSHEVFGGEVVGLAVPLPALFALGPVFADGHHHGLPQTVVEALGGGGGECLVVTELQKRLRVGQNGLNGVAHGTLLSKKITAHLYCASCTALRTVIYSIISSHQDADNRKVEFFHIFCKNIQLFDIICGHSWPFCSRRCVAPRQTRPVDRPGGV